MSENRHKETPLNPNEPFDYNAVPSRFYFSAEGVGAVPVKDVVEGGLDILTDNLANIIIAVNRETGAEGDEEDAGVGGEMVDPDMGYANGGGDMGGGANGYDAGYYGAPGGGYGGGFGLNR
jgi:DNA-directed RNA polymerase II subunit RPB3